MTLISRLPEALIAVLLSALELREHCAFRCCAHLYAEVARRPIASPRLLRLLASPSPLQATASAATKRQKGAPRTAPAAWDGRTRVRSSNVLRAVRGLRPRSVDICMENLNADAWLKKCGRNSGDNSGGNRGDSDDDRKESWSTRVLHLTISGRNCTVPLLETALRFGPRLETLRHTGWARESRLEPSSPRAPIVFVAPALTHLCVNLAYADDCRRLPPTLSTLVVEWPAVSADDGTGDAASSLAFVARWTAAVTQRFPGLTRLHLGHVAQGHVYSVETLARRLPYLTDLSVPLAEIPLAPLSVASRLEKLACTFVEPTVAVVDAPMARLEATADTAAAIDLDIKLSPPRLFGSRLHTLDLVNTEFSRAVSLAANAAPGLTALTNLSVDSDAELAHAAAALAHLPLRTLGLRAHAITTTQPLGVFAATLCELDIDSYRAIAIALSRVDPGDRTPAAMKRVSEAVARLWPPLPRLERLSLHGILRERDMHAVLARYPTVVDAGGSWANDTCRHWSAATRRSWTAVGTDET